MNRIDVRQIENQLINKSNKSNTKQINKNFNEVLQTIQQKDKEIKFSKHATQRLNNRNINISLDEIKRLESAFDKAEKNGVKDALILIDNKAFIANIKSKTIVTTVEKEKLKQNVFTNIDGAVII
jgi:flagellar operon protein